MNWYDFNQLKLKDKIKVLYEEGTFIVAIRYYKYKINLFLFENYYVEVFFNHKLDMIEKIEVMNRNTKRLKFYSDQIKLSI
ncbi:hypothetical protein [Fulvivirga lutea]|uniref:Uncharacterized protein n=1 Tax=Fulvivirga lutea TaxID=2810512 RepID=A0A974WIL3_9BACT|nr:hypothetical protein [Fulvivirga lutea]QSE97882.1 hypothetical protein JR347_01995 [Fulvivirga lutea]